MKRFLAGAPARAAAILCLFVPGLARAADIPAIYQAADAFCAHDAALLKGALCVLGLPVAASILANFRNRLPPPLVAAIGAVALNFVKAARKTTPVLAAAAIILLAGCTASQEAAVTGFEATALKGAQSAEDNNIALWKTDACGTPFSAVVRNAQTVPGLVPALSALCVPNADKGNPADLLKAVPSASPSAH